MHTQLQCTRTSLKILLRNPAITPAVHQLTEKDHSLGVAVLCLGSSDNTTKSRKCGCRHCCRQEHEQRGEKDDAWVKEGDISFLLSDEALHFPFMHKEMELCQKPCRCVSEWHADFHCIVTEMLVKRKQKTKIPATMQVFLYLSCDFYTPSAARWDVHKHFKKCQGSKASPVYSATYPYWSGWCTEGAWVLPQFACCEESMGCLPAPDWLE